jgi:hypothetical protein
MKGAQAFVNHYFRGCRKHAEEASAVFLAVEQLCGSDLADLDPEAALRDVLPEQTFHFDSLEAVELELALEEELKHEDLVKMAIRRHMDETIMKALLGPAAAACSWDPRTIWARSARGVINERVRLQAGDCVCSGPSNDKMQPTRPTHRTEPRR